MFGKVEGIKLGDGVEGIFCLHLLKGLISKHHRGFQNLQEQLDLHLQNKTQSLNHILNEKPSNREAYRCVYVFSIED